MRVGIFSRLLCGLTALNGAAILHGDEPNSFLVRTFQRIEVTDDYYSEGANAGDINQDGIPDIVYGPYWYAGPDYQVRHEIYEPQLQNMNKYANTFFSWVEDFNGDGWNDVLTVGFPGKPAYVYENPGANGNGHWKKHEVLDSVSNESPQLVDILGTGQKALVCTSGGFFGFATYAPKEGFQQWTFHRISEQDAPVPFGHGLGIGDVNGDGRNDIIASKGWYEQPAEDVTSSLWKFHPIDFGKRLRGGAEMHVYDVNGDGLNDIITSLAAHEYGLAWYEQVAVEGGEPEFRQHLIMGEHPAENKYGVVFSELHSVAFVDMDGDGLKDIVTGKTFYSHHKKTESWNDGPVVYWFKLTRTADGVDWIPYRANGDTGIGRQVSIVDVNQDGLPDIVVGGMKGANVLIQRVREATEDRWIAEQPAAR